MTSMPTALVVPKHQDLFYGGAWHKPQKGDYQTSQNPATGEALGKFAMASASDVDQAVSAGADAFKTWRDLPPLERARSLRGMAEVIRKNAAELAMLDSADGGNPVTEMGRDAQVAAASFDFFAGLVTEMKGSSIPMGPDAVNFSVREPWGVVARIVAFNHPFMFTAQKAAAPLAAGNAVLMKPPEQAPLSALRLAELSEGVLPCGVLGIITGGREAGEALASHDKVAMVTLIGSVPTGRAVAAAAARTLKPVLLELGGKNALIAYGDADPRKVADAVLRGMNFTWCGQSCGSTSRAFLHDAIHDEVVDLIREKVAAYRPGIPTNPATTMGAIISSAQHDKVMSYIAIGKEEGATLLCGGGRPADPSLAAGHFIEPTVFTDVRQTMRIAREEIFGPVLSVLRWNDESEMLREVNSVEYGLTCSIWTQRLSTAHRIASAVEAGFVWVNETGKHFAGVPFGGYKQSGIGREESIEELLAFTQLKNIHINLKAG